MNPKNILVAIGLSVLLFGLSACAGVSANNCVNSTCVDVGIQAGSRARDATVTVTVTSSVEVSDLTVSFSLAPTAYEATGDTTWHVHVVPTQPTVHQAAIRFTDSGAFRLVAMILTPDQQRALKGMNVLVTDTGLTPNPSDPGYGDPAHPAIRNPENPATVYPMRPLRTAVPMPTRK